MSISFFYPLAWLGAMAVAVPVWLHLRRLEDPHLVRFSALQFLDDQPAARRRRLWPHDWPLLLLRLLGLLLLVAAFAWPYLVSQEQEILINESRVYILDNTLSHQSGGGFVRARDEIVDQLQQSDLGTQIAVVEITNQPRVVLGFGDSRPDAIDRVQKLEASYQRGSYLAAFRLADRLLGQSLGDKRRIVLLGDSQENQWIEGRSLPPFLKNVDVTLPAASSSDVVNVALSQPIASRYFTGDRSVVKSAVTLYHQGPVDTVRIVYRIGGVDVIQREVSLSEQPESLTLLAEWEARPDEWIRGEIRADGVQDVLPGDNGVYFSLPPVREGRLGLLSHSTYLRTAFSPEVMRGRWAAHLLEPTDLPLEEQEHSDLDVLCVAGEYLQSDDARELVLDFLNGGRGVFLLVDRMTPEISRFLRRLDIEVLPDSPRSSVPTGFRYVFMEHPVFQPFRSADFGNLTDIVVQRYQRLKIPGAIPLVYSDAGDPLFFESQKTKGRLLVLAFSLHRDETDWPLHPTFIPFLDRCLQHVRSEITMQAQYQPGDACVWSIPSEREARDVVLRSADGSDAGTIVRAKVEGGQARFQVPGTPGLYVLTYDNRPAIEGMLAINPSPLEAQLKYSESPDAIAAWKHQDVDTNQKTDAASFPARLSTPSILRQRIWWWLVLGGLAALVLETTCLSLRKGQA